MSHIGVLLCNSGVCVCDIVVRYDRYDSVMWCDSVILCDSVMVNYSVVWCVL